MDLNYCYQRFQYKPHKGQRRVHEAARKYRKLCVLFGRRGGKSFAASFEAAISLLEPPHSFFGSPCCLITAPTVDLTRAVFERTHDLIFKSLQDYSPRYFRSERYIELQKLGSRLYVRSGDKPRSLVSRGYSKVIIDESGFFRDEAYNELSPALLERQGQILAIGVPSLQNWFFQLYKDIKRGLPDAFALQLPSIINPQISISEWKRIYRTTPRDEFLRQYCAKFIEDFSTVWRIRDLDNCLGGESEKFVPGFEYVAGIDFARKQDYTVVTILKVSSPYCVVDTLRLHGGSWTNQVEMIVNFLQSYNVQVATVDATGLGDAVVEQLVNSTSVPIAPFVFTNDSKSQIIDALTVLLEQGKIKIPVQFEEYHKEMKAFEYQVSKTGLRVFSAPEGLHDDHVMRLALAIRAVQYDNIGGVY